MEVSAHGTNPLTPRFAVRRLILADIDAIAALYRAGGRDAAWAQRDVIAALFYAGEWWGGWANGSLALCCALAPSFVQTPQAAALRGALAPKAPPRRFLLPPAFSAPGAARAGHFLDIVLARAAQLDAGSPDAGPMAALPVQSGTALLPGYFAGGFTLLAMRPLDHLRPHYLFEPSDAPRAEGCRIMVPVEDTLAASRLLAQGFRGIDARQTGGGLQLCLIQPDV